MTFAELEKRIPEWIKLVGKLKNFKLGISYLGWDWYVGNIKKKLQLNFNFYFPNGEKSFFMIVLPNEFFNIDLAKDLDKEAGITGHNLSEDKLIQVRFMYVLWWAHRCVLQIDQQTCVNNKLGIDVRPNGYLDFRQF